MTAQQRGPYEQMAKDAKVSGSDPNAPRGERYTSQGIPMSLIEKEKRVRDLAETNMKKHIEKIVKDSYLNNSKCSATSLKLRSEF